MIKHKSKFHSRNFEDLVPVMESWFKEWSPNKNHVPIKEYFGPGMGDKGVLLSLNSKKIIRAELDFKGIYVFLKNGNPFYTGISKHVVHRISQHIKGKSHFTSSLCYRLGAELHLKTEGKKHSGGRAGLDFEIYPKQAKEELFKCDVAMLEVSDDLELILFEIFVAMKLGTLNYNEFKTH
jgi:predicted GIY-YIG superfamily endonuclease